MTKETKEAEMTVLVLIELLVIVVLAIGLARALASNNSRNHSETRFQKAPIIVARAVSIRKYFRRHL
jgi:hypothetical protein